MVSTIGRSNIRQRVNKRGSWAHQGVGPKHVEGVSIRPGLKKDLDNVVVTPLSSNHEAGAAIIVAARGADALEK